MKKNDAGHTRTAPKSTLSSFLTIEIIDSSPSLARRLPYSLAKRIHAIPVASDRTSFTVAMADPEDPQAREAVLAAISFPVTIVKADIKVIDGLIARYYQPAPSKPLSVLAWNPAGIADPEGQAYINDLVGRLQARLSWLDEIPARQPWSILSVKAKEQEADLLICSGGRDPLHKLFSRMPAERKRFQQAAISVLSVQDPRWPIRQILLVLQDGRSDDCAVDWAIRMARACQSSLTILPVIPPPPAVFAGMQADLPNLMGSNSRLGRNLRLVAHRLVNWEVSGSIKIRDEPPEWQIRTEVSEGEYDLIIIGLELPTALENIVQQDLVPDLLSLASIPVLLTQNYP